MVLVKRNLRIGEVVMKTKLISSLFLIATIIPLTLQTSQEVQGSDLNSSNYTDTLVKENRKTNNFAEDKEAAKKWADSFYDGFNKSLTLQQKESLKEIPEIEKAMLSRGNDLSRYNKNEAQYSYYFDNITNLNKALDTRKGVLTEDLVVYKTVKLDSYLKMNTGMLFESPTSTYKDQVDKLKTLMTEGLISSLYEFDLTSNGASSLIKDGNLKLELTLPKGTNTGFKDSNSIFIQDNYGFKVDSFNIITEKNRKYISIKASLVPRDQVQEIIDKTETETNEILNAAMGFPDDEKLVSFKFEGLTATVGAKTSKETILNFVNNPKMSQDLKKRLMDEMRSVNKSGILFSDLFVHALDQLQGINLGPEYADSRMHGATLRNKNQHLYVYINSPGTMGDINKQPVNASTEFGIFIHELGHVFDYICGSSGMNVRKYTEKNASTFNLIYDKEKALISLYGQSKPVEFWAEFFRFKYSDQAGPTGVYENPSSFKDMKALIEKLLEQFV